MANQDEENPEKAQRVARKKTDQLHRMQTEKAKRIRLEKLMRQHPEVKALVERVEELESLGGTIKKAKTGK